MSEVVFYEVFEEEQIALRKFLSPRIPAEFTSKTIQESGSPLPSAKLISIRTQSKIPLEWASYLSGIFTRSQGYDHLIDYRRAGARKIPCGYIREYCSHAVAEHAILAAMVLLRKLKKQMISLETFSRDGLTGLECRGRRALIVGVGHIGSHIITLAKALGMAVKGVDPRHTHKDLQYVSLKEGLAWADVIFCSCCLTDETDGMLDYEQLRNAKKGSVFINIARGEISPIEDLERLLSEGTLGGISLDVFDQESSLADSLRAAQRQDINPQRRIIWKLKENENVLFTPHNAFNTREALEAKARFTAEAIERFLRQGMFPCAVPGE